MSGKRPPPPRLALTVFEAAQSIGVSEDSFRRHVLDHVRVVYVGDRKLIPVREVERYVERQAVALGGQT